MPGPAKMSPSPLHRLSFFKVMLHICLLKYALMYILHIIYLPIFKHSYLIKITCL